jgi:hypothetical protein
LVREVSDPLHLPRFCQIALTERAPDESTVRKLVRRSGDRRSPVIASSPSSARTPAAAPAA